MNRISYLVINGITLYRLVAAPVLIVLAFTRNLDVFKWLLALSFFTDLIDGYLARKFKVTSIAGARLDSVADDLTIAAGMVGLFLFKPEFIREEFLILCIVFGLFFIQLGMALVRYGKITSFHTWLAKTAAILQGTFLILCFFLPQPLYILFYLAAGITAIELIEEIILVLMLPKWKANVKSLYSVMKNRRTKS